MSREKVRSNRRSSIWEGVREGNVIAIVLRGM
jgi:hypothetical protein